jgi:hypothetical protein
MAPPVSTDFANKEEQPSPCGEVAKSGCERTENQTQAYHQKPMMTGETMYIYIEQVDFYMRRP